jgi:hypothetical protein
MPTQVGPFVVFGAIEGKWIELGGQGGSLGAPLNNETPTFDGTGRFQDFQNGTHISWHPDTGAHLVYGSIGARWLAIGREQFGYPINDESGCPDGVGRFNHFRAEQLGGHPEASIYWTPQTGAQEVYGAIRGKWIESGWEGGALGYPTGIEHDQPGGGRVQRFQKGVISWTPDAGAVIRLIGGDSTNFDTGRLPSDLPLGGSAQLLVHRSGDFLFTCHVHDSGFSNIEYGMATVLLSPTGVAFTFEHKGHVEGTSAGLPFGTPDRNDDFSVKGNDPRLAAEFDHLLEGGGFTGKLSGVDKLQQGITDLLEDAAKQLAAAGLKAVIALI